MNEAAQKHFDTIINMLLPLALERIRASGTFLPFGGFINQAGEYQDLQIDSAQQQEPKTIVDLFRKAFEEGVRNEGYRAFGICAHLHAAPPGQTEKRDVIVTSMEDESGVAVDSYLPYHKETNGVLTHGELTSELVEPTVFTSPKWLC